jgi:hypothetical protein
MLINYYLSKEPRPLWENLHDTCFPGLFELSLSCRVSFFVRGLGNLVSGPVAVAMPWC